MSASFSTIRNTSLLVICSFYYHMLFMITPYMFMFCFSINTPVCCMYFASSNINLATYFSLTHSRLLKLLLGSTPDSPTPSGPLKFEASSKRVAQPTSWSQRLTRLLTRHLRPNSEQLHLHTYDLLVLFLYFYSWNNMLQKHVLLFLLFLMHNAHITC